MSIFVQCYRVHLIRKRHGSFESPVSFMKLKKSALMLLTTYIWIYFMTSCKASDLTYPRQQICHSRVYNVGRIDGACRHTVAHYAGHCHLTIDPTIQRASAVANACRSNRREATELGGTEVVNTTFFAFLFRQYLKEHEH